MDRSPSWSGGPRDDEQVVFASMRSDGYERPLFTCRDTLGATVSPDQERFLLIVRPEGRQVAPLVLIQNWPAALDS